MSNWQLGSFLYAISSHNIIHKKQYYLQQPSICFYERISSPWNSSHEERASSNSPRYGLSVKPSHSQVQAKDQWYFVNPEDSHLEKSIDKIHMPNNIASFPPTFPALLLKGLGPLWPLLTMFAYSLDSRSKFRS